MNVLIGMADFFTKSDQGPVMVKTVESRNRCTITTEKTSAASAPASMLYVLGLIILKKLKSLENRIHKIMLCYISIILNISFDRLLSGVLP